MVSVEKKYPQLHFVEKAKPIMRGSHLNVSNKKVSSAAKCQSGESNSYKTRISRISQSGPIQPKPTLYSSISSIVQRKKPSSLVATPMSKSTDVGKIQTNLQTPPQNKTSHSCSKQTRNSNLNSSSDPTRITNKIASTSRVHSTEFIFENTPVSLNSADRIPIQTRNSMKATRSSASIQKSPSKERVMRETAVKNKTSGQVPISPSQVRRFKVLNSNSAERSHVKSADSRSQIPIIDLDYESESPSKLSGPRIASPLKHKSISQDGLDFDKLELKVIKPSIGVGRAGVGSAGGKVYIYMYIYYYFNFRFSNFFNP